MFILNGRVNGDKDGKLTCKDASVVDYFICTYDLLCFVDFLNVLEFSSLFSDVHSPISLELNLDKISNHSNSDENSKHNPIVTKKIKKWDTEKVVEYVENINVEKVDGLVVLLNSVENENVSRECVNELVEKVNNIMVKSAEKVFGTYNTRNFKKRNKINHDKPWFNGDCKQHKKAFRSAKRQYRLNKTDRNKSMLRTSEKSYKRVMSKAMLEHRRKMRKNLASLQKGNSKEFWNIIRTKKERSPPDIHINVLYNYFKDLNSSDELEGDLTELTEHEHIVFK